MAGAELNKSRIGHIDSDNAVDQTRDLFSIFLDSRWTAVCTRPRCEKRVAELCLRHSIAHYLPVRRREKRYQRRTVETWLPLFPGYIFAQLSVEDDMALMQSGKVVKVLAIDDAQELRLISELRNLQSIEAQSRWHELMVYPELVPGRNVEITSGPMAGIAGIVQRVDQQYVVTINIELLGQAVAVVLNADELQSFD